MLFVIEAVCFSRMTRSEYSPGKSNTSFNAGGIVLHNGIAKDNDSPASIDCEVSEKTLNKPITSVRFFKEEIPNL